MSTPIPLVIGESDVERGHPYRCDSCPIALAAIRRFGLTPPRDRVLVAGALTYWTDYAVPSKVRRFDFSFADPAAARAFMEAQARGEAGPCTILVVPVESRDPRRRTATAGSGRAQETPNAGRRAT